MNVKQLETRYFERAKKLIKINRETNKDIQETNRDKPPHPKSYYVKRENTRMRELRKISIQNERDKRKNRIINQHFVINESQRTIKQRKNNNRKKLKSIS